jgi:hypothetical protein
VQRWPELPTYQVARAALVAIGADLDLRQLSAVGASQAPGEGRNEAELAEVAMRLAAYAGCGDMDTDELVGLDITGDIPTGWRIAGWELHRYHEHELEAYEVVRETGARHGWSWDRIAAAQTWWLRRPIGRREAITGELITFSNPTIVALPPLLALALIKDEPPGALSHGYAQKGRGVGLGITSRELDYIIDDDGYPDPQYGIYRVCSNESPSWATDLAHIAGLVDQAFRLNNKHAQRYIAAAEQFLGVAADLYYGWNPLPRLAVEMSTTAEMLLLSGADEGEVSRRVRIAAAWLGGIDDADRDTIHDLVKILYDAGSKYRHGGGTYALHRGSPAPVVRKRLDVLRAYSVLRRLLLHGLAVVASGESIAELCERTQRSEAARVHLDEIIIRLYANLAMPAQPFT